MPPPPATTRRPRSLPDPIKGSHTAAGAQRPRHHSPFLPSTLGAPPSPSHFGRCLLPPSPGRLAAVHSWVRSQAGSSPPPPLFGYRIGEPECHPGCSPVSSVLPSMADPLWTEAGCGPRPVDQIHGFFLTKIILKSIIPGSFAKKPLGFSKINSQSMISQLGPLFLKNNPKKVPSLRKSTKIALKLQNSISFQPQLQIQ
jgi:hypothetical protein